MSNSKFEENENDKLLNIYKILLLIFPILIVSGNFISNGIVVLSFPIIFYIILTRKKINFFLNNEVLLVLFVFLYFLLSSIISKNIYSIEYSSRYLRFYIYPCCLLFLKLDEKFEKKFIKLFNLLFFILLIDGFYQYLNGSNFLGIEKKVDHRISGLFGDELILGSFISKYIFVFFIYYFFFKKNNKFIFLFFLISLIALTYISGERVAFFSIIVFATLALLKFAKFKELFIFFLFLLSILIMITIKDSTTRERMITETLKQTKFLKEWKNPKKILFYSDDHNAHYQSAYLMFKKGNYKHKLFGRGFKSFRINCSKKMFCDTPGGCCSRILIMYFSSNFETGLIGFAIYLYFFLNLLRNIVITYLKKINKPKFFLINLALFVNLLPIVPSGNIFGSFMSFNFAILISYYIYLKKNK